MLRNFLRCHRERVICDTLRASVQWLMHTQDPVKVSREMVAQLRASQIYRDYEQAFRATTGLPLALRPIEAFDLPHHNQPNENPFCAMMAQNSHSCSMCLQLRRKVEEEGRDGPKTLTCFAGLSDSSVPVRVGERLVGFLETGQVLLKAPSAKQFARTMRQLVQLGTELDLDATRAAYFDTRVLAPRHYEAVLRLLAIFGQHLSTLSNQLLVQSEAAEAPAIARARAYIAEHHGEELSLDVVARAANMSAYYFCKMFKRATGLTFTDYLARVRIERAKHLLLNPHKRISEAAFEVGFQSLSQFNRVFRAVAGESPSRYREKHQVAGRSCAVAVA